MQVLIDAGILLAAYIFGSVPFGLLIVKGLTGKDIRTVESGRTGGTNVYRAAGFSAGFFTAILDILKSAATVWLAREITPDAWVHVLAPVAAVIGHNHSIFLPERGPDGRLRFRGGAGGAAALGGAQPLHLPARTRPGRAPPFPGRGRRGSCFGWDLRPVAARRAYHASPWNPHLVGDRLCIGDHPQRRSYDHGHLCRASRAGTGPLGVCTLRPPGGTPDDLGAAPQYQTAHCGNRAPPRTTRQIAKNACATGTGNRSRTGRWEG
jgi:hypothetical protein